MIIVRLKGGLGNQMFQYSLGRVLSLKNNTELKLDTSYLDLDLKNVTKRTYDLDVFNLEVAKIDKKEISLIYRIAKNNLTINLVNLFRKITKSSGQEMSFKFDPKILSTSGDIYLDGYFQSPKYFSDYEDVIKKDFTFKGDWGTEIKNIAFEIQNTNSVCVFFRRTDFVGSAVHEVVDNEYYNRGLEYIKSKTSIDRVYVFSDDIEWCKKNVVYPYPTKFVDDQYNGYKYSSKLFLMSVCKYFVIPNSTFAWWAAWLCARPGKIVVAPIQWFGDSTIDSSDLIPDDWIRL